MTTDATLRGRTALVTGSVQGIGLAIARALAQAGVRVALHGLMEPAEGAALARQFGDGQLGDAETARFFAADLRDPAAIAAMMAELDAWGPVDILVNNAGIQQTAPLPEITLETWDAILAVNLRAAFLTMQAALPRMAARGYGRVINIASVHGLVASKNKAPYVAAKHGLVGLTREAALEYAAAGTRGQGGVTVNCICPGWTQTAIIAPQIAARAQALEGDEGAAIASLLSEKQPSLRMSDPSEIGAVALWLCQPIAHNITGIALPVDGGWTVQ